MGSRTKASGRAAVAQSGLFTPIEKWLKRKVKHARYRHIFLGDVNMRARKGTGFHHRYGGKNPSTARVRRRPDGSEWINANGPGGTYKAKVEVKGPDGNWYAKNGSSSFFPDHWTPQEVDNAIKHAHANSTADLVNPNKWNGSYNGVPISGFYGINGRGWKSAWPVVT